MYAYCVAFRLSSLKGLGGPLQSLSVVEGISMVHMHGAHMYILHEFGTLNTIYHVHSYVATRGICQVQSLPKHENIHLYNINLSPFMNFRICFLLIFCFYKVYIAEWNGMSGVQLCISHVFLKAATYTTQAQAALHLPLADTFCTKWHSPYIGQPENTQ